MALSTEEHSMLETACENMNIAANTCYDVLEMLRNLGSTGVVDIASHNNAVSVHENAKNLVHVSGNNPVFGTSGTVGSSIFGNVYPAIFMQSAYNNAFSCRFYGDTKGSGLSGNTLHVYQYFLGLTDSNGDALTFSDAATTLGTSNLGMVEIRASLKDSSNTITSQIKLYTNNLSGDGIKASQCIFTLADGDGVAANRFTVESDAVLPNNNITISLGQATKRFTTVYLADQPNVSSDRRIKDNITPIENAAADFILSLTPVSYTVKERAVEVATVDENGDAVETIASQGVRNHWGFVAQDVKAAMTQAGIEDAAVWCLADKNDPDSQQSLRYDELIAPLIKTVQVLAAKVAVLEAR